MATENSWGAPRINGELLRLGFEVSERSVSRCLRALPSPPRAGQTWTTFLRNHRDGIAAMDFFSVPTVTFRVLQVLLVIRHGRRDAARCAVTAIPTAAWVAQQLREAFPFDSVPRFMIFDRGAIFSAGVTATLRSRCQSCKKANLTKGTTTIERTFPSLGGKVRTVVENVPALVCPGCSEAVVAGEDLGRAELIAAGRLIDAGARSGTLLSWTRRSLGLLATDLAAPLGVTAETVSR